MPKALGVGPAHAPTYRRRDFRSRGSPPLRKKPIITISQGLNAWSRGVTACCDFPYLLRFSRSQGGPRYPLLPASFTHASNLNQPSSLHVEPCNNKPCQSRLRGSVRSIGSHWSATYRASYPDCIRHKCLNRHTVARWHGVVSIRGI
jgi:hypothetical protein